MDRNRVLYDPQNQAIAPEVLAKQRADALDQEWDRVWELPLPFYKERYEAAGLRRDERPPLDEIPVSTKPDLRRDEELHPPFGRHAAVHLDDAAALSVSGGTTGKPMLHFRTKRDLERQIAVAVRQWWRMGVRPGDRFTHCWPGGLYGPGLQRSLDRLDVMEIAVGPVTSVDVAAADVALWSLLRPNAFMLTGHQLLMLGDGAAQAGIDLRSIFEGTTCALVEPSLQFERPRRRVEELYGMHVHNIGGASDIPGFNIGDCRHHTGLHAPGDGIVVQVTDPATGREVPPRERGRLVVTLFGVDSFMMRFDVEDYVEAVDGECPCGETGDRYRFIGRGADAVHAGGRMVFPLDLQLALEDHGAPEFQLAKSDDGVLHLKVETDLARRAIEEAIDHALSVPSRVECVEPGSLPRSPWKARRST